MLPLHTSVVARHPPVMTWIIVGLNAFAFFIELSLPQEQLMALVYEYGVVPARYTQPGLGERFALTQYDLVPLVTNMFLHGGWLHFIGNMWTLVIFGRNVEDRMGPARFAVFYLLCGLAASFVHILANSQSQVPAIGASGAISGVMGAYLVMFPFSRVVVMIPILFFPFIFEFFAFFYLGYWFLIQLLAGTMTLVRSAVNEGGIAFWAHVGGFVCGALIHAVFLRPRSERPRLQPDEGTIEHAWEII